MGGREKEGGGREDMGEKWEGGHGREEEEGKIYMIVVCEST